MIVKLELDVEAKGRSNLLEGLLEGAEGVVLLNEPADDLSILGLPQQGLARSLRLPLWPVAQELFQGQLGHSLLEHCPLQIP